MLNRNCFNWVKPWWLCAKRCAPTRLPASSSTSTSLWVSAQSKPTYHILALPFLHIFLGVSGPYIPGARSNGPPIVDWPRKEARGSTIFLYRSSRVERGGFPRQCLSGREQPCQPLVQRAWKNINI